MEVQLNRGFEIVKKYKNKSIQLPSRSTKLAAGYDFQSAENITIGPNEVKLIPTGIKAFMDDNEFLQLVNRSSNPIKKGVVLANAIGIVDADYYNNEQNEGEIFFQMQNITGQDVEIKKNDRIGQGIFLQYLTINNDQPTNQRAGGFGSTGD